MSDPKTSSSWGILLSKLWLESGQALPIGVKDIALEVTKQKFNDPIGLIKDHKVGGIDGMLSKRQKGDWCISYDGSVQLSGRINFTIAHEFGHYLLHRQLQESFRCGQSEMLDYESQTSKKLESEANKFASYLLMPANDFRTQIDGQIVSVALISHCAARYGTTFTATALKWIELTHEAAMLVVARDEFICWSYPSKLARRLNCYLPPSTAVPQSSLDWSNGSRIKNSQNTSRPVSAGVWHNTLEAEESVIISDQFELTIFLVRFPSSGLIEHEEVQELDAFETLTRNRFF